MPEVNMPRLSDTMEEGTIARWLKKTGDAIKKGEVLAEIETDKATMDLEAYDSGVLEQIMVEAGSTVPIGQAIARIGDGSGQAAAKSEPPKAKQAATSQAPEAPAKEAGAPSTDKEDTATSALPSGAQAATADDAGVAPTEVQVVGENGHQADDRQFIKASPLARRIAEERKVDLRQIHGSGPGGRIVRDDIEDFLEQRPTEATTPVRSSESAPTPPAAAPAETGEAGTEESEAVPLTRVQTLIARRLTEAKQTVPHFYVSSEIDMTELLVLRQQLNADVGEGGLKVSVNDLIIKACALALEAHPEVNSSFKDGQFVRHKVINIGMAVDIPSGLVVPVVHDANIKGVRSIARETHALIEKARANRLAPTDLAGGTFSVSNLGMLDVSEFIAVINPPEAAILAVSSTRKRFVPINDQPVVRDLMTVTLSADHRILYGATVARFLQEVKRLLQTPFQLLG